MTEDQPRPEAAIDRAAAHLAQALSQLQQASDAQARAALDDLARRIAQELQAEREQRLLLGGQLTTLATSLDRLVDHLQGLSQLMADLLERLASPAPLVAQPPAAEPTFAPGGEGVSLVLAAVPGFQALMDVQKALVGLEQVVSASVERFQEGESRLLLILAAPVTADDLAAGLRRATGLNILVEEARPELLRLRLKIVPSA